MSFRLKLIIIGLIIIPSYFLFINPYGLNRKITKIDNFIKTALSEFNIKPFDLVKEVHEFKKIRFHRIETIVKTYNVSSDFSFESFRAVLEKELRRNGLHILLWEKNVKENTYRMDIGLRNIKLYTLMLRAIKKETIKVPVSYKKAKVAIVIDDFGYNIRNIDSWLNFDRPITFSILPNLSYSTQIASLANDKGREIILHLPLEPKDEEAEAQEKFTITTSMPQKEILKILESAIKSVPNIKGVSNHQGSRATEDKKVMGIVLKELKKRNFYFLDSLVTNNSVCREIASSLNLKFVQRDVFLDNVDDVEYIKNQLNKLARIAQTKGFAIGIGHVHLKTLEALKEASPFLEEEGIEFVYLSELLK
ncbi:MAG: divergent polysaccharide deacetylase family protein [Candidatus Omnitrophica bacterium]|nr:divergent polysaccharide deacetylase family protein [Candidatus Omnitrophota bacterium]